MSTENPPDVPGTVIRTGASRPAASVLPAAVLSAAVLSTAVVTTALLAGRWLRTRVGWAAVGATVVLGAFGVWLVTQADNDGGPVWVVCILLVTSALLLARSVPLAAAASVFGGVGAGQWLGGPLVTCGVVLPVATVLAYGLASRPPRPRSLVLSGALLVGVFGLELLFDPVFGYPNTTDPSGLIFIAVFETGFVVAGLVSRGRRQTLERLRSKTRELVRQREQTAAAAIAADRARVGVDLDLAVREELRQLAMATDRGLQFSAVGESASTRAAFVEVERRGRAVLAGMRAVVGTLDHPGTEPPPGIAQLDGLVRRATAADVRLRVDGPVRPIGPHLELSVYRVVEYVLGAAADRPGDRVDVRLSFDLGTVGIRVTGLAERIDDGADGGTWVSLDAARTRAEVAGGRLDILPATSGPEIWVQLPTPAALSPVA